MLRSLLAASFVAALAACSSGHPIRLTELRDAPDLTPRAAAYDRLEQAVELVAGYFQSPAAAAYPARSPQIALGLNDILIDHGDGLRPFRIYHTSLGEFDASRGIAGRLGLHGGLSTGRIWEAGETTGDLIADNSFLSLRPPAMAALLVHELARKVIQDQEGAGRYAGNVLFHGVLHAEGFGEGNWMNRSANRAWHAFWDWYARQHYAEDCLCQDCTGSSQAAVAAAAFSPAPPSLEIPNYLILAPGIAAGGQPTDAQLAALGEVGYRTVVNTRGLAEGPDGEAALLEAQGIEYHSIPIDSSDELEAEHGELLAGLLASAPRPILIHCRSGNRVGGLWGLYLAQQCEMPVDEAILAARRAGARKDSLTNRLRALLSE